MDTIIKGATLFDGTGAARKLRQDVALEGAVIKAVGEDLPANGDARVVEAVILVENPEALQRLTNLQVDVEIWP